MTRSSRRQPTFSRLIAVILAPALSILLLATTVAASPAVSGRPVPSVPGYPPVASPHVTTPAPLPRMDGSVPLDADLRIGAGDATTSRGATTLRSSTAEA